MLPVPSRLFVALALGTLWGLSRPLYADWPQGGGPNRDFDLP